LRRPLTAGVAQITLLHIALVVAKEAMKEGVGCRR
jgi:hypothetical protein